MGINEIIKPIKKSLLISVRLSYQSICNHPVLISFSIFLLFLYKYFPSLLSFLLSTSPVLICTTLLLGILLSFGQPNYPQTEEEKQIANEISTRNLQIKPNLPQIGEEQITTKISTRDLQIRPNLPQIEKENSQIEPNQTAPIQNEPNITERELEGVLFSEEGSTTSYPKTEERENQNTTLERETQEREATTQTGESEPSFARAFSLNEISLEDQIEIDSPQWQRIDGQDQSSDFESDGGESSSPDASMTDIIPMLEEIHPLLDLDQNTPQTKKNEHSDSDSHSSLDLNSNDEEEEERERETESAKKGNESNQNAFSWTADDQKNVMDLGYSEMERNQRLENLMARRRSRKNIVFDRNLIDLDSSPRSFGTGSGTGTGTDDLSQFRVSVPPVSVSRSNPFDDPSVPGSAPSVFNPRRNPFDFTPYEQPNESSIFPRESFSPREYMNVSHQNTFFKKYDSFNYSTERRASRLKPYFVPDFGTGSGRDVFGDDTLGSLGLETGLDSPIGDPLSKEEREKEERETGSESETDDGNSVDVELDQSEFEPNGERESPSSHAFDYLHSLDDKTPLESPVPDLLVWDDEPAEARLGGASSSSSQSREIEENYEKTSQFRTMDLHSIPEEEPTENPKPELINPKPSEPDLDSDEDADRIFPEPIDESLLTELDQIGDFMPAHHVLGFQSTVSDAEIRVSNGSDPEQTVYNPRRHVLLEASSLDDEINAVFDEEGLNRDLDSRILQSEESGISIPGFGGEGSGLVDETDSGMLVLNAKSVEEIDSVFTQVGEFLGESSVKRIENPGFENPESGILDISASSFDDIESALMQATESEDVGLIGETKSGILILKANSKAGLESVFKQMGEFLGKSDPGNENPGFVEDLDSGMMVLDAKCINDIDSAFEGIGNGDDGLIDETESGMLVMKAKSKKDIESVFKQVGEVLGKSDPGFGNSESGMMVLEAKCINDIDAAILNASEIEGNGDDGLIDETESGMLIMKASSKADIESVFKQVGEVLGKSDPGNRNTEFIEDSDSGILELNAKSIEDIDSAMFQVSENMGNENDGLVDETDSGMLIMKAKSKEEIESVFKQVGELLGKQNPGNEIPDFTEDSDSGMMVLDAKSINDIDSAIFHMSEDQENKFDETENGMLILKANSKAGMESVFKQVGEVLGKQNPGNEIPDFTEGSDSGMLVFNAKSINDIDSAILHMSEDQENDFDETENGMLVLKTKSKADMDSVFKQVSEALGGTSIPGFGNPEFVEETESGMLVVKAKSIEDINTAIKQASEINEMNGSNVEEFSK